MILWYVVEETAWAPETLWFLPKSHKFHGLWSIREKERQWSVSRSDTLTATFQSNTSSKITLTGKQKTSSSVDLLFLMVDICMPWETWRKAEKRRKTSEYNCHVLDSQPKARAGGKRARTKGKEAAESLAAFTKCWVLTNAAVEGPPHWQHVRWDQSSSAHHQPQHYLRRFIPSLLFVASVTCCLRMLSSSALRSLPGQAQILASKHRRPNTWPLGGRQGHRAWQNLGHKQSTT